MSQPFYTDLLFNPVFLNYILDILMHMLMKSDVQLDDISNLWQYNLRYTVENSLTTLI